MLLAIGVALALFVLRDAVHTAVNLSQRTSLLAGGVLRAGRRLAHLLPGREPASTGLVVTMGMVAVWTVGIWLAWTIALLDPAVVITGEEGQPAGGWWDAAYLAGISVFTLGTGDIEPANTVTRLTTVAASWTGLFVVTLEVTYLLSLVQAAIHERQTARRANALGDGVAAIIERAWDGTSFGSIEPVLQDLARDLSALAEQHRTFPVLYDVRPTRPELALGPALLAVSDAVEVLRHAPPDELALSRLTYDQITAALDGMGNALPPPRLTPDPPPREDAASLLAGVGAPAADDAAASARAVERRCTFYRLAVEEGYGTAADAVVGYGSGGRA